MYTVQVLNIVVVVELEDCHQTNRHHYCGQDESASMDRLDRNTWDVDAGEDAIYHGGYLEKNHAKHAD